MAPVNIPPLHIGAPHPKRNNSEIDCRFLEESDNALCIESRFADFAETEAYAFLRDACAVRMPALSPFKT